MASCGARDRFDSTMFRTGASLLNVMVSKLAQTSRTSDVACLQSNMIASPAIVLTCDSTRCDFAVTVAAEDYRAARAEAAALGWSEPGPGFDWCPAHTRWQNTD